MSDIDWSATFTAEAVAAITHGEWSAENAKLWRVRGHLLFPLAFKKPGQKSRFSRMGLYEIGLLYYLSRGSLSLQQAAGHIRRRMIGDWVLTDQQGRMTRRPTLSVEELVKGPPVEYLPDFHERDWSNCYFWKFDVHGLMIGISRGNETLNDLSIIREIGHINTEIHAFNVTAILCHVDYALEKLGGCHD